MIFLKSVFPAVQGICPDASLFWPWHYVQKINWQCSKKHIALSRSARSFLCHEVMVDSSECERCSLLSPSDGEGLKLLNASLI